MRFLRRLRQSLRPAPVRTLRRLSLAGLMMAACGGAGGFAAAAAPPDESQLRAFFLAVQMDDARTVGKMVGTVVNANERDPVGGEPALVLAIREGATDVVRNLLAHPGTDLERTARNGNTALMMAAFKRDGATTRALLDKGARVDQAGWTALHYAAASGDAAIAQLLIARGARVDALSPRATGAVTPLMMAAREGQDATVRLLLAQGARKDLTNTEGFSAARLARNAGHDRIASMLGGG